MLINKAFKQYFVIAVLTVLPLVGCATEKTLPPAPQADSATHQFLLSPGDKIHLTVYEEERMTGDYTVDENGKVVLPLIGGVQASGLTKNDLQLRIAGALQMEGLYKTPHVAVDIANLRPFYILGEVNHPGAYPYEPSLNVFSAVALAGGYTPRAAKKGIIINRDENGQKERFSADEDTPIYPGDSLTIRQRFF